MMPWIAHMLVSSTLLMILVLALRRPVAKAFGARTAYALWLLPALRMILPPLPGQRALYVPALQLDPARPIRVGLMPPDLPGDRVALPPELLHALEPVPHAAWSWSALLVAAWLAGAALWFGWQMVRYRRFVAHALEGAIPLGSECRVDVLLSAHVDGPVASGVLHRRIFLPRDFVMRYTSAERRQALLHEGAHHDRHDLLANLCGLAVLALHWWNPVAHCAHRAFRSDQELACDATVLAQADAGERYAYGSALMKSACARTPAAACALDPATEIKRRLRMIGRRRRPLPLRAAGTLLATVAIGGGLFATASSGAPSAVARESVAPAALVPALLPPAPAPAPIPALRNGPSSAPAPAPPAPVAPTAPLPPVASIAAEAERAARLAAADARLARLQARLAAEHARRFRDGAGYETLAGLDATRIAQVSLDQTRARMIAQCAARGQPVRSDERDWGELALCGRAAFQASLRRSIDAAPLPGRGFDDWPL